jgi:hypothetical protein
MRLARVLIGAVWGWVLLVVLLTFWGAWEIPARMPDVNEVATIHLFLFPVSLVLFLVLSWLRKSHDDAEVTPGLRSSARWHATVGVWVLLLLHPVSCGLYPAAFNLDMKTVEDISREVGKLQVEFSRAQVEQLIMNLNRTLPVSMGTDLAQHRMRQAEVERYLTERDPAFRKALWPRLSRATFVFIPWGLKPGVEPDLEGREQLFLRRSRATSDIGVDKIKVRYGRGFMMEEVVYSSNRQLTEFRTPCTIHLIVPSPPEASFPYPCPPEERGIPASLLK